MGLLPKYGCGITNLVSRTTARADELSDDELRAGRLRLARKVRRYRPKWVAFVGLGAFRVAFDTKAATVGPQVETTASAQVCVLPNTSGLNANYQPKDFAEQFTRLRRAIKAGTANRP